MNNNIRLLNPKECLELADALGENHKTAISIHLLRRGYCRAYLIGEISQFKGVIIQNIFDPEELMGFGTDQKILWELLKAVDNWTCVEVDNECAPELGQIIESETGIKVRYYDDIYYTLQKPAIDFQNDCVRQLTLNDLELLESSPEDLTKTCFVNVYNLLTNGISAGAIVSGRLVGVAHTSARTEKYSDIGVFVLDDYRNRGFATASASIVAQRVQENGQIPVWSAGEGNIASQRVAKKIGFTEVSRCTYVILPSYR